MGMENLTYEEACLKISEKTDKDETKQEGGEDFEQLVALSLIYSKEFKDVFPNKTFNYPFTSYKFNYITEELKVKFHIPPRGEGIDGLLLDYSGKYHAYQVKFTQRETLEDEKLHSFYRVAPEMCVFGLTNPQYIFTNAERLSACINEEAGVWNFRNGKFFEEIYPFHFNREIVEVEEKEENRKIPYPIQKEIVNKIVYHFGNGNTKGTILLACGMGKSLISYWTVRDLILKEELFKTGNILILVPRLCLLDQFYKTVKEEVSYDFSISEVAFLKVGSGENDEKEDVITTTSLDEIANFFQRKETTKFIFSTYQSFYLLKKYSFELAIFDEAHFTVGRDNIYKSAMNDKDTNISRRLFMTATGKIIVNNEYYKEKIYSMDNEDQYGKKIAECSFLKGIQEEILSDYKVICLAAGNIEEQNKEKMIVQMTEETIVSNDLTEEEKCHKILLFVPNREKLNLIKEIYQNIYPERKIMTLIGTDKSRKRRKILREFENSEEPVILISIRVLLQGYDCRSCDAIVFTNDSSNMIILVQAMGRCLRKYPGKKLGKVVIPYISNGNLFDGKDLAYKNLRQILFQLALYDQSVFERVKLRIVKEKKEKEKDKENNGLEVKEINEIKEIEEIREKFKWMLEEIKLRIQSPSEELYDHWRKFFKNYREKLREENKTREEKEMYKYLRSEEDYKIFREKNQQLELPEDPIKFFKEIGFKWWDFLEYKFQDFYTAEELKKEIKKYIKGNLSSENRKFVFQQFYINDKKVLFYLQFLNINMDELFPHNYNIFLPSVLKNK